MYDEIWKVRSVKPYKEAKNHLFIGKLKEYTITHVRILCRTFHFGSSSAMGEKSVAVGDCVERIIPWARIECVNVLDNDFDFRTAKLIQENGNIVLTDDSTGLSYAVCKRSSGY